MFDSLRKTSRNRLGGALRILVGFVFFMAGILKVVVPSLGEAFAGQLVAANIPLHGAVLYTFPVIEMVLGILLLVGFHARIAASVAAASMIVATYVHIAIDDPSLFPLQPVEPIGPLMEHRPKGICAQLTLLMSDSGRFAPVSAGYQLGPLRSENGSLRWLEKRCSDRRKPARSGT
jgi:uncharacterized membrane protein YphA (DoxX/SURF4 family)